jgi:hypothetical protein
MAANGDRPFFRPDISQVGAPPGAMAARLDEIAPGQRLRGDAAELAAAGGRW